MKKKGSGIKTREVVIKGKTFVRSAFNPTRYPGVTVTESASHSADGEPLRTYYIQFRLAGRSFFEKALVRDPADDSRWIPARTVVEASGLRAAKIAGDELPTSVRREQEAAAKKAETGKWTFDRLWEAWKADPEQGHLDKNGEVDLKQGKRGTLKADLRYGKHISASPEDIKKRMEDSPDAPPAIGGREPKDLTSDDIDRFRLYLANHYSRETTKSIIGLVTRIARYGASKGYCAGLSFPVILRGKQLGKEPKKKRAPNAAEYATYLSTCDAWPDKQAGNFQKFIAYTGIRRASARNLKRGDVDLVNKTVLLRDSKTGDVKIALSNNAVALLREHLDLPRNLGNPYIFTGSDPDGKRSQKQIDTIPRKIANAAGLPADLDPCHAFRRFLATRLKKYGTKVGMDAGGWKDPKMLLHYQSATADDVRDALNEEDARIAESTNGTA